MAHNTRKRHTLDAHRVALEAAALVLRLVASRTGTLADQLRRSVVSVAANLAEGTGRSGRDRSYHWRIAYGSALESRTHLELLLLTDAVEAAASSAMNEGLGRRPCGVAGSMSVSVKTNRAQLSRRP